MRSGAKTIQKEVLGLISRQTNYVQHVYTVPCLYRETDVIASSKVCTEHSKNTSEEDLRGRMAPAHSPDNNCLH